MKKIRGINTRDIYNNNQVIKLNEKIRPELIQNFVDISSAPRYRDRLKENKRKRRIFLK